MKYKQYAVKFATLQEFVITDSGGTMKRFVFRNPKKLVIKKCDGYWLINKDDIVLCHEWGNTWREALNDYKLGVFNTYIVCNSNLDDYLYNFCEAMKCDFDKEIMVYNEGGIVKNLSL